MICLNCMTHWTVQSYPLKTVELVQPPTTTNPWPLSSSRHLPVWPHWVLTWCQPGFPGFAFYSAGKIRSRCNPLMRKALLRWLRGVGLPTQCFGGLFPFLCGCVYDCGTTTWNWNVVSLETRVFCRHSVKFLALGGSPECNTICSAGSRTTQESLL